MHNKYKSYVYILPLADKSNFKIGKTKDPTSRFETLMSIHDIDVDTSVLYECSCDGESYEIESIMHKIFSQDRNRIDGDGGTEFFKYSSFEAATKIMNDISKYRGLTRRKVYRHGDAKVISDIKVNSILVDTGAAIKTRRLFMNMSQTELADVCGLSRQTVGTAECSGNSSFENVVKILKALEMEDVLSVPHERLVDRKRASGNGYKII